jgi:hypothetical protein
MGFFRSPMVDNIVLVTAIINVVGLLFVFFTCRFIPALHLADRLAHARWYKPIYKIHSYLWWMLVPSALIHGIIALIHRLSGG